MQWSSGGSLSIGCRQWASSDCIGALPMKASQFTATNRITTPSSRSTRAATRLAAAMFQALTPQLP